MKTSLLGPAFAVGVVFAAVAGTPACGSRSVIGHQDGGTGGGTGGNAGMGGNAGHGGGAGTLVSTGSAGNAGAAGAVIPAGAAGTGNTAGDFGSRGGTVGTAGMGGTGNECPSGPGGGAPAGAPLVGAIQLATNRYGALVDAADMNGDGKPDIVAANYYFADQTGITAAAGRPAGDAGSISVFLSLGAGGFDLPQHTSTVNVATSFAVGDLDGDGKPDVAFVNARGVGVMLNDGSGRLSAPEIFATGVDPVWVAMGDLNADGRRDLVVANRGYGNNTQTDGDVAVLLNLGSKPMFSAANFPAGKHPVHVAIGDLSGDGQPELVVAHSMGVAVLYQNAPGTFTPSVGSLGGGESAVFTAIADLNADARPDLVVWGFTNAVGVLLNAGGGLFGAPMILDFPTMFPFAIGDLNGDGRPDLIGALGVFGCGAVTFAPNTGDGHFGPSGTVAVSPTLTGPPAIHDLDGDGRLDVAVPNVDGVAVLLNAL